MSHNCYHFRPHSQLPELQKAIPFPPPAVLQTTLPTETTVIPAPQFSTVLPESTKIILPVLPETVPLIAQVGFINKQQYLALKKQLLH